jgi:hypothetical protein
MLEAANARPRFTISLKRSTQNLQLSTSRRPITPSFGAKQLELDLLVRALVIRAPLAYEGHVRHCMRPILIVKRRPVWAAG